MAFSDVDSAERTPTTSPNAFFFEFGYAWGPGMCFEAESQPHGSQAVGSLTPHRALLSSASEAAPASGLDGLAAPATDDHLAQLFFARLAPEGLCACAAGCRRWRQQLKPDGPVWREALQRCGGRGFAVAADGLRWPGLATRVVKGPGLWAVPLAAYREEDMEWHPADYRALLKQVEHWVSKAMLPCCPLCSGVAFYQGKGFTRDDIPTGWQSYMLCHRGARRLFPKLFHI